MDLALPCRSRRRRDRGVGGDRLDAGRPERAERDAGRRHDAAPDDRRDDRADDSAALPDSSDDDPGAARPAAAATASDRVAARAKRLDAGARVAPTSAKREAALAKARQALAAGLPQVGVIDSSRYSSLHPGYYVVFSGVYDSLSAAQTAASRAADAGYGNAYARRVTS